MVLQGRLGFATIRTDNLSDLSVVTLSAQPKPEKFRMQEPGMDITSLCGVFLLASLAWAFSGPRLTADENTPFLFPAKGSGRHGMGTT